MFKSKIPYCRIGSKIQGKIIERGKGLIFCDFLVFNATFGNISAISWRPVLLVEEARVPGENH